MGRNDAYLFWQLITFFLSSQIQSLFKTNEVNILNWPNFQGNPLFDQTKKVISERNFFLNIFFKSRFFPTKTDFNYKFKKSELKLLNYFDIIL